MNIVTPPTLVKMFDAVDSEISLVSSIGTHTTPTIGVTATAGANDWRPANAVTISNTDCAYNSQLYMRWKPSPAVDMSAGDCICLILDYSAYPDVEAVGLTDPPVPVVNPAVRIGIHNIMICSTTSPFGANARALASSILNVHYKEKYTVICLRKSDFTNYDSTGTIVDYGDTGYYDFSTVALVDVRIIQQDTAADNASGNPINIKVLSMWTYDSATLVDKIPVVLSFDDQFQSVYDNLLEFTSRNIPITHCITESNWSPTANKFTTAQGLEMYGYGHDFVNHGSTHKDNDLNSAAVMFADHDAGWDEMKARGVRPNNVKTGAYPFGRCDEEYNDLLDSDGYEFMRGTAKGHPGIADTSPTPKYCAQRGHPILFGELMSRWNKISIPMNGTDSELDTAALHLSYLDINRKNAMASFHHGHGFQASGPVTDPLYWLESELVLFLDGLVDRMADGYDAYTPIEVVTLSRGANSYLASMGVEGLSSGGGVTMNRRRNRR